MHHKLNYVKSLVYELLENLEKERELRIFVRKKKWPEKKREKYNLISLDEMH